jgi:hypothetical protein
MAMSVRDDLARKLGLLQTPPLPQAKDWSNRTRELMKNGESADNAAMIAAKAVFPAEFNPTKYDPKGSVEALLDAIDAAT